MNRKNELVKGYRTELIIRCGNKCCIDDCLNGDLEFAHLKPTKLNGMGRGSKERFYDVIKNLDKYTLSCKFHHDLYDSLPYEEKPKLLSLKDLVEKYKYFYANYKNECPNKKDCVCIITNQVCNGELWKLCSFNFFRFTKPDNCSNSTEQYECERFE